MLTYAFFFSLIQPLFFLFRSVLRYTLDRLKQIITAVVAKGHRPGYFELEEDTFPPSMVKLANMCWTQEPEARPKSLNVVVTQLGHIVNALGGDPRSLLDNQVIFFLTIVVYGMYTTKRGLFGSKGL